MAVLPLLALGASGCHILGKAIDASCSIAGTAVDTGMKVAGHGIGVAASAVTLCPRGVIHHGSHAACDVTHGAEDVLEAAAGVPKSAVH
jgi:hypothetical protein